MLRPLLWTCLLFGSVLSCGPNMRNSDWFMARLRGAPQPNHGVIDNRVDHTVPADSFDQAYSVLVPLSPEVPTCRTTHDDLFDVGSCVRTADCWFGGGVRHGACAGGIGNCCVFERSCSQSSDSHMSYFTNPGYPVPTDGFGECKLRISHMNQNICQFRIEFEKVSIFGPDRSSECVTDTISITGGSNVPRLCGKLDGQHLYVDTKPGGGPIEISIDTSRDGPKSRVWKIKIVQIPCNSPNKVPAGCLQFYNGTSGTIKSFNFDREIPRIGSTKQLKNHRYGICVSSLVGYCTLTWSPTYTRHSFSLSGTNSRNTSQSVFSIERCNSDYISIPGGIFVDKNGVSRSMERFCGTKFPNKVSTNLRQYMLYVHMNGDETNDVSNAGFSLDFRHSLC